MNHKLLKKITPKQEEIQNIRELIETIQLDALSIKGKHLNAKVFGSAARETYINKKLKDLDLFIEYKNLKDQEEFTTIFSTFLKNIELKSRGYLYYRGEYYFKGKSYFIDLLPYCKTQKLSFYRTELHNQYLLKNLTPVLKEQILMLKFFLKKTGLYGSDTIKKGFSGYLCQCLILKYGTISVIPSLVELKSFIDPVDKNRNLLAAVSLRNLFTFDYLIKNKWIRKKGPSINELVHVKVKEDKKLRTLTILEKKPCVIRVQLIQNQLFLIKNPYTLKKVNYNCFINLSNQVLVKDDSFYQLSIENKKEFAEEVIVTDKKVLKIFSYFFY